MAPPLDIGYSSIDMLIHIILITLIAMLEAPESSVFSPESTEVKTLNWDLVMGSRAEGSLDSFYRCVGSNRTTIIYDIALAILCLYFWFWKKAEIALTVAVNELYYGPNYLG